MRRTPKFFGKKNCQRTREEGLKVAVAWRKEQKRANVKRDQTINVLVE